jgi:hypothetical protein
MSLSQADIPCLYNFFSFTPENINNRMMYYDLDSFKERHVPLRLLPASLPALVSPSSASSSASSSDTESDDNENNDDGDDTSSSSKMSVSLPCEPSIGFHRDRMMEFVISPSGAASDSLLWIAYIMIYGLEKFETIENYYTESNTFKFDLVEMIRKNKPILKANKIKLSGLEENLVHKPFIHLETMQAIVLCKNISLCIVQERKYYEIQNGASSGGAIIEKIKGKYILYACPEKIKNEYLQYIRENYWLMESISAPIRPISAYKLQDLIDISTKLGLPVVNIIPGKFGSIGTEKRKTKPELYEAICKCI